MLQEVCVCVFVEKLLKEYFLSTSNRVWQTKLESVCFVGTSDSVASFH